MGDGGLVDAELYAAGLDLFDGIGDVERDGVGLGARHESAGSEDFTEASGYLHNVRRGDYRIEVKSAVLDLSDQVFAADDVRARVLGFPLLLAEGEDGHSLRVAGSEGKYDGAAHLLVRVAGVNAQTNMEFEAFVKLRRRAFFSERYGFRKRILFREIDFFEQRLVTFSCS